MSKKRRNLNKDINIPESLPRYLIRKDYLNSTNNDYILIVPCPECNDDSMVYSGNADYFGCGSVFSNCSYTCSKIELLAFEIVRYLEETMK